MKFDLVIAGVGGQGNIVASQAIAQCAMDAGFTVVNTETKGAAQRGGSVLSHVRLADREIYSPVVPHGQADVLLGFEPLEALRYINILSKGGKYIINMAPVPTILANMGIDTYPSEQEILSEVAARGLTGYRINATQAAKELGNVLLTNVIMLGAFTAIADILPAEAILHKLLSMVDPKFHEADIRAFRRGREMIAAQL
ncbi:MAG: indolepyruvate oxidoreductase subunit beta [Negativicutes bacterium]|nr:indolepyruvate oxidoreductase subunit beta [Negativicutes bacterium]